MSDAPANGIVVQLYAQRQGWRAGGRRPEQQGSVLAAQQFRQSQRTAATAVGMVLGTCGAPKSLG